MKVIVLPQAEESMKRSIQHLSEFYDRRYLKNLERLVRRKIRWLGGNPGAGQFEPELAWMNLGHRRIIVRNFKVLYRLVGEHVVVNDIFDSRRDPDRMRG
jgi:toxin ParE1/3/4